MLMLLGALLLCACDELGPPGPWIPWEEIAAPLRPELSQPSAPPPSPSGLRVVTFNVHFAADVPALAQALRAHPDLRSGDLFLLQELRSFPEEGRSRAARLAQALGLGYAYVPARPEGSGTHGLGILSRYPLQNLQVMELPRAELAGVAERRVACSFDLLLSAGALRVVNVHLDTRINLSQRVRQLRPAVVDAPQRSLVAGDFNSNDLLWAGGALPQLPVTSTTGGDQSEGLSDYMEALGYLAPTRGLGATAPAPGLTLRLDAAFTRGLAVGAAAVARDVDVSDHWPLWLQVQPGA